MKQIAAPRWLALLLLLSAAPATPSCASKASTPATPGAGEDASADGSGPGTLDDGGTETGPTSSIICGAAPYVSLGLVVRQIPIGGGTGAPIEGATLTSSLCPGLAALTAADGVVSAQITKDAPFFPRLEGPNYATTLIAEMQFGADQSGINVPLPPALYTAIVPAFGPTKTAIIVGVSKGGGTGACDALDGIVLTVTDHPEAKVTYFSADPIPQATTGTTTTTAGRAAITELPVGAPVTVVGTKAGCTVDFARAPYTGHAPLEAGAITLVQSYLH
jgi:hypothetical protein